MVNDRLQPMRAAPVMKVLVMMAGVLGIAAGTARAAQAPPATALPAGRAAIEAPSLMAERVGTPAPARAPGQNSGTVSAGSPRPSAIRPAVPEKTRHRRSPVRVSGKGPKTAGARKGTAESAPTLQERTLDVRRRTQGSFQAVGAAGRRHCRDRRADAWYLAAGQPGVGDRPCACGWDCARGISKQNDSRGDELHQTGVLPEGRRCGL